jgi:hypothetical protein
MITYLANSYFHQDFRIEASSPRAVVQRFIDEEDRRALISLSREISEILESGIYEQEAREIWMVRSRSAFDPQVEGWTCIEWFRIILEMLNREVNAGT